MCISESWLREAEQSVKDAGAAEVNVEQGNATRLSYEDDSFDIVWCAQSLYSLPRMFDCLTEMRRVLRPGGYLCILENDSMHHVLLPWPPSLEVRIIAAELKEARETARQPEKYYSGRWLSRLMRRAGLRRTQERSFASTRQQPLSAAATEYFAAYLESLRKRVRKHLSPAASHRLDQLLDPDSRRCLWKQRDFVAVSLDRLVWAQK
ncbi:class I SAM-dependent methyltransferase [Anatilimnocola floriformis]|uniref:class I SAM-dependent methyltransferase n=1 Tax=Anatilimnocola floriformis TaxID=2948575 RepID=UPI0036F32496